MKENEITEVAEKLRDVRHISKIYEIFKQSNCHVQSISTFRKRFNEYNNERYSYMEDFVRYYIDNNVVKLESIKENTIKYLESRE